jgi:phosphoribosyl 1,2-cyclic phosphodiesterase
MRLAVLASGSSGNALAVEHEGTTVFIDSGLSAREHARRLEQAGFSGVEPVALFLTHEHSDHVNGAGVVARKWKIPVFATQGTLDGSGGRMGKVPEEVAIENGSTIEMKSMRVTSFSVPHDADDPSGYVIEWNGGRLGIATDLGIPGPLVTRMLSGCTALVLEFNHDRDMLWSGPYPWPLKQRIDSNTGHLSNDTAAGLLESVDSECLGTCVLAHLSEENNRPELAMDAARKVLTGTCGKIMAGMQHRALHCLDLE